MTATQLKRRLKFQAYKQDMARLNRLTFDHGTTISEPPRTALLQVSTDSFVAGAIWKKIYGIWSCTKTAPIIHWMRGMNQDQAKLALLRMNASWQWIASPLQEAHAGGCPNRSGGTARVTNCPARNTNPDTLDGERRDGSGRRNSPDLAGAAVGRSSLLTPGEAFDGAMARTAGWVIP